jgi:hypothetical protein
MNEATEIIKVQLAIVPRGGPALFYDQHRRRRLTRQLTGAERQMMGDNLKAFFNARWTEGTGWHLISRAPFQYW